MREHRRRRGRAQAESSSIISIPILETSETTGTPIIEIGAQTEPIEDDPVSRLCYTYWRRSLAPLLNL